MQGGRPGSWKTRSRSALGCPPTSAPTSCSTRLPTSSGRAPINVSARARCRSIRAPWARPEAASAADQRNENTRHAAPPRQLAHAGFLAEQQSLVVSVAHWDRDFSARSKLLDQGAWHLRRRGGNQDSIIGRVGSETEAAVAQA